MSSFIFNSFKERFLKGEVPENDTWFFKPVNSKFKENFETDDIKLENYRTYNDFKNTAIAKSKKIDDCFSEMKKYTYSYTKKSSDDNVAKPPFITRDNIDNLIKSNNYNSNIKNLKKLFFDKNADFGYTINALSNNGFYFVKSKEEFAWCANRVNGDIEGSSERGNIYNNHINIVLGDNIGESKKYTQINHQLGKYEDRPYLGILFGFGFSFLNTEIICDSNSNGLVGYLGETGQIQNLYFKNSKGFATRLICKKKLNIPHMKKDACDINAGLFAGCNYGRISYCRVDGEYAGEKARVEFSKFVPSVYLVQNKSENTTNPVLDSNDEFNINCNAFYPNYFCINSPGNIVPYCGYFSEGLYGTWKSENKDDKKDYWNINHRGYDSTNVKSIGQYYNKDYGKGYGAILYDYGAHAFTHSVINGKKEFDIKDEDLGILGILEGKAENSKQLKYVQFFDRVIKPHEFNRAAYYVSPLVGTNYGNLNDNTINADIFFMGTFVGFEGGACGKLVRGRVHNNFLYQDIYDNGGNRDWFVSTAQNDIADQPEMIKINLDKEKTKDSYIKNQSDYNGIYLNIKDLKKCTVKGISYTVSANNDLNISTGTDNQKNIKKCILGNFIESNCYNKFSLTDIKDKKESYTANDETVSGLMSLTATKIYEFRNSENLKFYNTAAASNWDNCNLQLSFFSDCDELYKNNAISANLGEFYNDISAIPNGNIVISKGEKKTRFTVNQKFKFPVIKTFSGFRADGYNHYKTSIVNVKDEKNNTYLESHDPFYTDTIFDPVLNYVEMDGIVFETKANENEDTYCFISGYNAASGYLNADLLKVVSAANVKYHTLWINPQVSWATNGITHEVKHGIIELGNIGEGNYNTFGIYSKNESNFYYKDSSGYGYDPLYDGEKSYSQIYQRFFIPEREDTMSYLAELKSIYNVGGLCGMHAYGNDVEVSNNKVYLDNNIPVYVKYDKNGNHVVNECFSKDYGALNRFGGFAAISEIRSSLISDIGFSSTEKQYNHRTIALMNNYFTYHETIGGTSKVTGQDTVKLAPYNMGTGSVFNFGTGSPLIAEVKVINRKIPGVQNYLTTFHSKQKADPDPENKPMTKTQFTNDLGLVCSRKNPNGFTVDLQVDSYCDNLYNYRANNWKSAGGNGVYPTDPKDIISTMYDWNNNQIQKMNGGVCSADPCAMTTISTMLLNEMDYRNTGDYKTQKHIGTYSYFGSSLTPTNAANGLPKYINDVDFMNPSNIRAVNIDTNIYKVPTRNITPTIKDQDKYNYFSYTRGSETVTPFNGLEYKVKFDINKKNVAGYWLQDSINKGYKGQAGYDYDGATIHIGETYNPQAIREMISKTGKATSSSVSASDFQGLYVYDSQGNNVMYIETEYGDMDKYNTWSLSLKKFDIAKHSEVSGCILEIN